MITRGALMTIILVGFGLMIVVCIIGYLLEERAIRRNRRDRGGPGGIGIALLMVLCMLAAGCICSPGASMFAGDVSLLHINNRGSDVRVDQSGVSNAVDVASSSQPEGGATLTAPSSPPAPAAAVWPLTSALLRQPAPAPLTAPATASAAPPTNAVPAPLEAAVTPEAPPGATPPLQEAAPVPPLVTRFQEGAPVL